MRAGDSAARADISRQGDRKAALLQRLHGAEPPRAAGAGFALPEGAPARLAALLREIDETVLPRILSLHCGGTEAGRISVSHRHVIAVDLAAQPAAQSGSLAQRCASGLTTLAEMSGPLTLWTLRRSGVPGHAEPALSVSALQAALASSPTGNAFERLHDLLRRTALARLEWAGPNPRPQFSGLPDWAPALQNLAAASITGAQSPAKGAQISRPRTEGLAIPLSGQQILILARLDQSGIAALMPFAAGLEAITAWQRGG